MGFLYFLIIFVNVLSEILEPHLINSVNIKIFRLISLGGLDWGLIRVRFVGGVNVVRRELVFVNELLFY
jgi:hypothetical protein